MVMAKAELPAFNKKRLHPAAEFNVKTARMSC
jgi:hypothetical protein